MCTLTLRRWGSTRDFDTLDAMGQRVEVCEEQRGKFDQLIDLLGGPIFIFMHFHIAFSANGMRKLHQCFWNAPRLSKLFNSGLQAAISRRILLTHGPFKCFAHVVDDRRKEARVTGLQALNESLSYVVWNVRRRRRGADVGVSPLNCNLANSHISNQRRLGNRERILLKVPIEQALNILWRVCCYSKKHRAIADRADAHGVGSSVLRPEVRRPRHERCLPSPTRIMRAVPLESSHVASTITATTVAP